MGEQYIFAIVFGGIGTLLGVFAGYWFNNVNKKQDKALAGIQTNTLDINTHTTELAALKEANEKAQLKLREDMSALAADMKETSGMMRDIGIKVGNNTYRIANLESEHRLISERIRKRDKS